MGLQIFDTECEGGECVRMAWGLVSDREMTARKPYPCARCYHSCPSRMLRVSNQSVVVVCYDQIPRPKTERLSGYP